MIEEKSQQKRIRNDHEFTGEQKVVKLQYVKCTIERFTQTQYSQKFLKYRFRDITCQFVIDFTARIDTWTKNLQKIISLYPIIPNIAYFTITDFGMIILLIK